MALAWSCANWALVLLTGSGHAWAWPRLLPPSLPAWRPGGPCRPALLTGGSRLWRVGLVTLHPVPCHQGSGSSTSRASSFSPQTRLSRGHLTGGRVPGRGTLSGLAATRPHCATRSSGGLGSANLLSDTPDRPWPWRLGLQLALGSAVANVCGHLRSQVGRPEAPSWPCGAGAPGFCFHVRGLRGGPVVAQHHPRPDSHGHHPAPPRPGQAAPPLLS